MFENIYSNKRVLVTGHTGFKGSWLCCWLLQLGATVAGYSIDIPTEPANFSALGLEDKICHHLGDVCDIERLSAAIDEFQPELIFHLAAQPLVRDSYADPLGTFRTNALGTLNLLECVRKRPSVEAVVLITSDKAYRNVEWQWGYRESDHLGGEDPYSASKGCAELIAYSYIQSFFNGKGAKTRVATARAGNVIGGGDWAKDRIVPDCIRSWSSNNKVTLRNPNATRPWQHVLEPLSGYLWLGAQLLKFNQAVMGESYNFGPDALVNHSVETLIKDMAAHWNEPAWEVDSADNGQKPEAGLLKLCCDKALSHLKWHAVLGFDETVKFTSEWYHHFYNEDGANMFTYTNEQIKKYCQLSKNKALAWT